MWLGRALRFGYGMGPSSSVPPKPHTAVADATLFAELDPGLQAVGGDCILRYIAVHRVMLTHAHGLREEGECGLMHQFLSLVARARLHTYRYIYTDTDLLYVSILCCPCPALYLHCSAYVTCSWTYAALKRCKGLVYFHYARIAPTRVRNVYP